MEVLAALSLLSIRLHTTAKLPGRHWTAEHDMAEGGQLLPAGCMRAEVCDSGVPQWMCLLKAPLAVQQMPDHHLSWHVQGS